MEAEHVETLDLAGLAAFKIKDSDLAKALALMGKDQTAVLAARL
jgi:hypothetical protein